MSLSNLCYAEQIEINCTSKTKLSNYHVVINTINNTALLNYDFMGQRLSYTVENGKLRNKIFSGIATFYSSQTGENKDEPFMLEIDLTKKTLKENSFLYLCN